MNRQHQPKTFCRLIFPLLLATAIASPVFAAATSAEILKQSKPADWRPLDPQQTLYMELPGGRVVIELSSRFAPEHVANIKTLVRGGWFDGLAIDRVQDNYVVQWGDADGKRDNPNAKRVLEPEYTRSTAGLPFVALPDPDTYAPQTGFVDDMPTAVDAKHKRAWPVHCYGIVGVGRDMPPDSGSGAELYVVIGQAPRHLDRNLALVGRVVEGMDRLTALPRGTGDLGFYEKPEQRLPINRIKLAADVPEAERLPLEVLRTDTKTFSEYVKARRSRTDAFFVEPADRIDVCNLPVPVRRTPGTEKPAASSPARASSS